MTCWRGVSPPGAGNVKTESERMDPDCAPAEILSTIAIQPRRKRLFRLADGRTMEPDAGFCILETDGFRTIDEVVFTVPGDLHLLGMRTLECRRHGMRGKAERAEKLLGDGRSMIADWWLGC